MKIVPKISATQINGVTKAFKKVTHRRDLMRIVGLVHGFTPTETHTEFKGEFQAINSKGEAFVSTKCILPADLQADVLSAMGPASKRLSVTVAADVSIEPAQGGLGYAYVVSALSPVEVFNPLESITRNLPAYTPVDSTPLTLTSAAVAATPAPATVVEKDPRKAAPKAAK